ncbi:MAG: DUF4386 domain-containing protein [bacterium]
MSSAKATAHRAGVLYFLFMIVAIVREFLFPTFMVPGDAAATARNITAAEPMYRVGILMSFVTLVMFLFLVALLYELFRDVDRSHTMLMVLLVGVGVAMSLANLIAQFAPLVLLSGADYLSAFTKPQLDALSLGFLRLHSSGSAAATAFWGLWLFPFGILVIKSGFFPRILGILLLVAGFAYVAFSVIALVLPEYRQVAYRVLMPLYFGEVPIILWLLIKGANAPQHAAAASEVR